MPVAPDQAGLKSSSKIRVDFREISLTGSQIYHGAGIEDYNPDKLVGKKGLEIYREMLNDDQVKAVLTMKKFARIMTPWEIQPASDDAIDVEIADFVWDTLTNMEGTFEDILLNIFSALEYGYSVSEKVWYRIEKGEWAGKIGLKNIKTREPFYYAFESDIYGNLKQDGIIYKGPVPVDISQQKQVVPNQIYQGYSYGYRLPIDKFVVYSYNKDFSNHYGRSDLRAAYRSYWSKEILIRYMNIYMERFGMATHIAKYPKNMSKPDREDLRDVLDKVQAKYSIVIPDDVTVELLQVGGGGEGAYKDAIEMHNKFISRSILVPDLLGFTEGRSGAYALGKKHFDVFLWILQKLGRDVEEGIVGEQIIKQLVDYNYSGVSQYPVFKFENIMAEGTAIKAGIVQMGIAGGFINPEEEWIREYLALPKKEDDIQLGLPQGPAGPENLMKTAQTLLDSGNDNRRKDLEDRRAQQIKSGVESGDDEEVNEEETFTVSKEYVDACRKWKQRNQEVKKFAKNGLKADPRFDYKINYTQMEEDLNEFEAESVKTLSEIVKSQKEALLKTVEKKKLVEEKDYDGINALQLRFVGEFKKAFENRLIKLHLDCKLGALRELELGTDGEIQIVTKFANVTVQNWIPVDPTEAIDFFNRKVTAKVVKKDGQKKLITLANRKELNYYDAKAFAIAGIERDNILKKAKVILLDGIRMGDPQNAIYGLGKLFDEYIASGEIKDEDLASPFRLETIVRTNFSEAMNNGRKVMMNDPDVADFVPYVQYKAIMDDRVRPSHAAMHNRIYTRTNPIVDVITPPNGFNCRCNMVPITSYEVDKLNEKGDGIEVSDDDPLPSNMPDQGFGKYASTTKSIVVTIDLPEMESKENILNSSIVELQSRLASLESGINSMKSGVLLKDSELKALNDEKNEMLQKLVDMSSQMKSKQDSDAKVVQLQSELERNIKEKEKLSNMILALKSDSQDAMKELGLTKTNAQSQLLLLASQQATLQNEIDRLRREIQDKSKVEVDAMYLRKQMADLSIKNAELENKLMALENEKIRRIKDSEMEVTLLKNRIDVLTKELSLISKSSSGGATPRNSEELEIIDGKPLNEEISRCPYPNCGSSAIVTKEDSMGTQTIQCNKCLNIAKVTREKELYLFDKVKNLWSKADLSFAPNYITGNIQKYEGILEDKNIMAGGQVEGLYGPRGLCRITPTPLP